MANEFITYLNHIGYNPLKFPRENVEPLLVLAGEKDSLDVMGTLSSITSSNKVKPNVTYDDEAAFVSGKRMKKMDSNVCLNLLSGLLSKIGNLGANAKNDYKKMVKSDIIFENVLHDWVYPAEVMEYLNSIQPKGGSFLTNMRENEKAYLITDIIKSNKFGIIAYNEQGETVEINLTGIKDALDASANLKIYEEEDGVIWYEGTKHLTFAFKALPFWLKRNLMNKFQYEIAIREGLVMKGKPLGKTEGYVFAPDEFIDIIEEKEQKHAIG